MISKARLGQLYLLVGPPGVGKNALMKIVLDRFSDIHQLPTATTRDPRPGEQEGREHYFISHDTFREWIAGNRLIEYQVVHSGNYYGTPRHTVEDSIHQQHDRIADIEVLGATQLRQQYPDNTVLIFIQPPSRDDLIERMRQRGENEASIASRMLRVDMEMAYAPLCDYLITNDNLHHAGEQLLGIIHAERSRRDLLNLRVERRLPRRPVLQQAVLLVMDEESVIVKAHPVTLPSAHVVMEEAPSDAALRALQSISDDLAPFPEVKLLTTLLDYQGDIERIRFYFTCNTAHAIDLKESWQWESILQVALPVEVREALEKTPTSRLEAEPSL